MRRFLPTLLASLTLIASSSWATVPSTDTLVVAGASDLTGFDPALCYDTGCAEVLQNTLETLVFYRRASPSQFEPALLETLPTRPNGGISPDGRTYTLRLRAGLRFADGSPLTSGDVVYSLWRMLLTSSEEGPAGLLLEALFGSPELLNLSPESYARVTSAVRAKDARTVTLKLERPFAPLLGVLATPYYGIYSQADAKKRGAWGGAVSSWTQFHNPSAATPFGAQPPLGSGPYTLERLDPSRLVVLRANPRYRRGEAKLKRILLERVLDSNLRRQMLLSGDADIVTLERSELLALPPAKGVTVIDDQPGVSLSALFFNERMVGSEVLGGGRLSEDGVPPDFLAQSSVRRGLAASLNVPELIAQGLAGKATQTSTFLVPGLLGYSPNLPRYRHDPVQAKRFFQSAYGGKLWKSGFTLPLFYPVDDVGGQRTLAQLKRNLERLNPRFHLNLRPVLRSDLLARRTSGAVSVWSGRWSADYLDPHNFGYPLLHSRGLIAGSAHYPPSTLDSLLERGFAETDSRKRIKLYREAAQLAWNDARMIALYQERTFYVQRSAVRGRLMNPMFAGDYYFSMSKVSR